MASFQLEIAPSSEFGCIMRNHHSRQNHCNTGDSTSFPENLKDLVHSCISSDPRNSNSADPNDNVNNVVNLTDLWVHKPQYLTNINEKTPKKRGSNKTTDNWDKARKKVFPKEGKYDNKVGFVGKPLEAPRVVSSLVKKWRDFEAESKPLASGDNNNNINNNSNDSSSCPTRTNSGVTLLQESISFVDIPPTWSRDCDSSSNEDESPTNDNDSFKDWESDRRVVSAPPSVRGRDSDATESERVRVIDIIKKLTSSGGDDNQDREHMSNVAVNEAPPLTRVNKSCTEHGSSNCAVVQSPRISIRGRQALNDLIVQIERERARELEGLMERKAVSKFQQKGRIQAMLKLKFLRREANMKDAPRGNSSCITPESSRSTKSSILHLREKFKEVVQKGLADSKATIEEASCDKNIELETVSTPNPEKESHHEETSDELYQNKKEATKNASKQIDEIGTITQSHQTGSSIDEEPLKNLSCEVRCDDGFTESVDTVKFICKREDVFNNSNKHKNMSEWRRDWEENDWSWVSDCSHDDANSRWDQLQFDFQQDDDLQQRVEEMCQDWINDVSRPRSQWEDLRQARYQEMLDPFFNNGDLQQLLERKSVSNFLSGESRDKIDQLMISRSQKQPTIISNGIEQTQEHEMEIVEDKIEEAVKSATEGKLNQEDEENIDSINNNQIRQHNSECEINDESYHIASTSLSQGQSPNIIFPQANEMNFVDELMGHMHQLHQEISEIRRAIISCIDMQMKLHHSIKDEVASAFNNLGKQNGRTLSKTNYCSVCHEITINSLLYRCGHMCTCFKCAQELQHANEKCPICRAPIMDVVFVNPSMREVL
ncbi:unnamed protein product [Cuscuta epithymum]|uniref:RING-type domain-containing protein n=1 Tax=Cuscuta epithymum TaxID=186058 RepID=A0AAV0G151_9ASTE|nr:unnamed protein product [Cuscuta epithymum]